MKQISLITFIILTTIFITSSPFIFGLLDTPKGTSYLGTHFLNSGDTFAYYGLYTQVKHGDFLFFNPYTPEKHSAIFFRPTFFLALLIFKIFSTNTITAYHFFRIIFGIILLITLFNFIKLFFNKNKYFLFIFTLVIFGSGLGWLTINHIKDTLDLWIPETNVFLSLMEAPHFQFSLILILIIFGLWIKNFEKPSLIRSITSSILAFILFFCHPFDAPLLYLTLIIYSLIIILLKISFNKKSAILYLCLFILFSSIPIIYQSYLIKINIIAKYWAIQNINTSPSIRGLISGLGIWMPLGIAGLFFSIKKKDKNIILISSWAISYLLLIYFPVNIQRRFLEGLFIPYIILSCYFIFNILLSYSYFNKKNIRLLFLLFLIILLFTSSYSNLILLKIDYTKLTNNKYLPFYADNNLIKGLKWLQNYDNNLKTILANWDISYLLPSYIYGQTLWGHKVQTIKLYEKEIEINDYFNNKLDDIERKKFYKKYNIKYLIWDKIDIQKHYKPENDIYLKKIYYENYIQIYKINLISELCALPSDFYCLK